MKRVNQMVAAELPEDRGPQLLRTWMEEEKLTQESAAERIGCCKQVDVSHYLSERRRPAPHIRIAIHRATRGKVPMLSWLTPKERAAVAAADAAVAADTKAKRRPRVRVVRDRAAPPQDDGQQTT